MQKAIRTKITAVQSQLMSRPHIMNAYIDAKGDDVMNRRTTLLISLILYVVLAIVLILSAVFHFG